jgi:predicted nucleic-acid-binding protein
MIGIDTNILVRIIANDDPDQSGRAKRLFMDAAAGGSPLFINDAVLCEAFWVLRSAYRIAPMIIADAFQRLADTKGTVFENETRVRAVILTCKEREGDFADLLIGEINREAGCSATYTFDRKAARLAHFQLLT